MLDVQPRWVINSKLLWLHPESGACLSSLTSQGQAQGLPATPAALQAQPPCDVDTGAGDSGLLPLRDTACELLEDLVTALCCSPACPDGIALLLVCPECC